MKMKKQMWIVVAALVLGTGAASADWTPVKQGQFTYYQSGESQAFPVNNRGWYYMKAQGSTANEWEFFHAIGEDPTTKEVIYSIVWTDGTRMMQYYPQDRQWRSLDCDLAVLAKYRGEKYQAFVAGSGSDYRAFYMAEYFEADRLLAACRQLKRQ